jgi:hypothetical protein
LLPISPTGHETAHPANMRRNTAHTYYALTRAITSDLRRHGRILGFRK